MLQTQLKLTLFGRDYIVSYPTVGQKLQIETAKILYSGGIYGQLAKSDTKTANELLDIIDSFSYFSVLIPELKNNFKPELLDNLDLETSHMLTTQFKSYYKFIQGLEDELFKQLTNTAKEGDATNGK